VSRDIKRIRVSRAIKRVCVKVFSGSAGDPIKRIFKAPPGKCFTAKGVDDLLDSFAAHLEKSFPNRDFRMVEIAGSQFNFVSDLRQPNPLPEICDAAER
jgi:hypothetical protein